MNRSPSADALPEPFHWCLAIGLVGPRANEGAAQDGQDATEHRAGTLAIERQDAEGHWDRQKRDIVTRA